MMRFILWLGIVLGVLWGGYWFVGSRAITAGAGQWVADMQAQGLTFEHEGITVSGFPSRFDLTMARPRLEDPVTGWGWKAPFAQVLSMVWKPWHVIAVFPDDQEIVGPDQRIALTTRKMQGSLRLKPSTDLTFEELVIEIHDLTARSDLGWVVGAGSAVLAVARDDKVPLGQRIGLSVTDLRPDPVLAQRLPQLGKVISTVHLDSTVILSAPLDRHAAVTAPVVTEVVVRDLRLIWGSLRLSAKGQVKPGPDGVAVGQIDIRIEDWRQVPALAVALGLVRPEMGDSLIDGLEVLAKSGGDPDILNLPLTFADGWMSLGPVPLGPAPVFLQRQ